MSTLAWIVSGGIAMAVISLAGALTLLKRFEESAEHRQRDTSIRVSIELPAGAPGPSRS